MWPRPHFLMSRIVESKGLNQQVETFRAELFADVGKQLEVKKNQFGFLFNYFTPSYASEENFVHKLLYSALRMHVLYAKKKFNYATEITFCSKCQVLY